MSFKTVKKVCLQCGKPIALSSTRDLERKKFCSHRCRGQHHFLNGSRPKPATGPRGTPAYTRIISCELCGDEVQGAHPLQRWCEECTPDHKWRARAMRYGVGKKDWDRMLDDQGGICALCPNKPEVVDHNHETGKVRGLLCGACNLKLAGIDDSEWLVRALEYVRGI